jgi:hypothetical protein
VGCEDSPHRQLCALSPGRWAAKTAHHTKERNVREAEKGRKENGRTLYNIVQGGGTMKKKFNIEALMKIYSENVKDKAFFLDKTTGDVITLTLTNPDLNELKRIKERIAKEPGRFPQIPKRTAAEGFKDMENFMTTLKDIKLKKRLGDALEAQSAFRAFRDALDAHPRERQAWNTYRDDIMKKAVMAFLREIGIPSSELQ